MADEITSVRSFTVHDAIGHAADALALAEMATSSASIELYMAIARAWMDLGEMVAKYPTPVHYDVVLKGSGKDVESFVAARIGKNPPEAVSAP